MGKTGLCVQGWEVHFPTDLHQTRSKLCLDIAINAPATILQSFEKCGLTEQNAEVPQKWTKYTFSKVFKKYFHDFVLVIKHLLDHQTRNQTELRSTNLLAGSF